MRGAERRTARKGDAPVAAGVVEGLHARLRANDDDGLPDVLVLYPVAYFGNLLFPAGHLPDVWPQMIYFRLVELRVVVPLYRDPLRIVDRERHRPQTAIG